MYKILIYISFLLVLSSFRSDDNYEKPLSNILFDRNGYYYLVQEDWIENTTRIIKNPYVIEEYKNQLEIKITNHICTSQYDFIVVKDNKIINRIGYSEPNQLKIGKELDSAFQKVTRKNLEELSKEEYLKKIEEFNKNGILWYSSGLKEYDGTFTIYVRIKKSDYEKLGWSFISSEIYSKLVSKHPILTNRLDIFFKSSSPNDDFIIWKIDIKGNIDFLKTVKTINLNEIEIINSYEYKGFEANTYDLIYFNEQKDYKEIQLPTTNKPNAR